MLTREQVLDKLSPYPNLSAIILGCVSGKLTEWPMMRPELTRLIETIETQAQQARAWQLAFEGLERQHKALADQIPAEMIQADTILLERVTTAAAMEEIGRQQIADLQRANATLTQRVQELEVLVKVNSHDHMCKAQRVAELEAELARVKGEGV